MPLTLVYSALKKKKRPIILHYAHFFVLLQSISEERGLTVLYFFALHSDSSAVGSVLRSGRRGREFESPLSDRSPPFLSFRGKGGLFLLLQ